MIRWKCGKHISGTLALRCQYVWVRYRLFIIVIFKALRMVQQDRQYRRVKTDQHLARLKIVGRYGEKSLDGRGYKAYDRLVGCLVYR